MRVSTVALVAIMTIETCPATTAWAQDLPEGVGRQRVEAVCSACHRTNLITQSSGYTRADWDTLTAAMVDLSGDPVLKGEILDYLASNFPVSNNRIAKRAPGDLDLEFEGWVVPTLGQRARDPVEASDGSIWWVGQWADILGRLDPESGAMLEFSLPEGAKPHSIEIGPDGGLWYTGNKNATLGRLDRETGEIEVFEMPDPAARDPHTHVFDSAGRLWFTLQQSNMVGRLDPATGAIDLVSAPKPGSRPYGVKIADNGVVWVARNGSNCLLRLDPETMTVTEVGLPEPGTTVRRLDIDAKGRIWWVNSGLGRLGLYDPATGEIREWPSPSGPGSHPYAIAIFEDAIWYNESGVRPDMLVRFDPGRETFQSWPIPSGEIYAGVVRHMRVSRDGKSVLIHQTATNRIGRVTVRQRQTRLRTNVQARRAPAPLVLNVEHPVGPPSGLTQVKARPARPKDDAMADSSRRPIEQSPRRHLIWINPEEELLGTQSQNQACVEDDIDASVVGVDLTRMLPRIRSQLVTLSYDHPMVRTNCQAAPQDVFNGLPGVFRPQLR